MDVLVFLMHCDNRPIFQVKEFHGLQETVDFPVLILRREFVRYLNDIGGCVVLHYYKITLQPIIFVCWKDTILFDTKIQPISFYGVIIF